VSFRAVMAENRVQVFAGREYAARADEALDLEEQREKCGEIDSAEGAEEKPAWPKLAVAAERSGAEEPGERATEAVEHNGGIIAAVASGERRVAREPRIARRI